MNSELKVKWEEDDMIVDGEKTIWNEVLKYLHVVYTSVIDSNLIVNEEDKLKVI